MWSLASISQARVAPSKKPKIRLAAWQSAGFFPSNYSRMMAPSSPVLVILQIYLAFFTNFFSSCETIKIGSDGGYTDIVIQINDQVPEDHCPEILQNLKVFLSADSCQASRFL